MAVALVVVVAVVAVVVAVAAAAVVVVMAVTVVVTAGIDSRDHDSVRLPGMLQTNVWHSKFGYTKF